MSATNNFLAFCPTDTGTNLLTQLQYAAAADRTNGNQPGVASSKLNNKAIRQASAIISQLAQYICNKTGSDMLDNNDLATLLANLTAAFNSPPNIITHLSGTGTYTPSAGLKFVKIRLAGAGGGGSGGSTGGAGGTGGTSTFGTTFLTCTGGGGGSSIDVTAGGTASGGDLNFSGAYGSGAPAVVNGCGGSGGNNTGFPGAGSGGAGGEAAHAVIANTGSGGGGAGADGAAFGGGGGSAGGYLEKTISAASLLTSYSWAVGAAGAAGTPGDHAATPGAAGILIIEENF